MSVPASNSHGMSERTTEIPIRNVWYMLLYVWDALHVQDRWRAAVEEAPTLDALLARVLADQIEQRFRIGMGRDYREEAAERAGIRGRVDFNECIKKMSFRHGRAFCRYQIFDVDVPRNQIIRSVLTHVAKVGNFGTGQKKAQELKSRLHSVARAMPGVSILELKPDLIGRELLKRQDGDYSLMLSICYLLVQRYMPREKAGDYYLPHANRDELSLYDIYEKFVAKFYEHHLTEWTVALQKTIRWPTEAHSDYVPVMKPDLTLEHEESGKLIVLDTKFTGASLTGGRWGNTTFNRDHVFQIYAYLRSQEEESPEHRCSTGILLYPTVGHRLSERVKIQGHSIHWETVDLSQPWRGIEADLLSIPEVIRMGQGRE